MVKPVLQAILLADHIYEDKSTGKKIIAGTFNTLGLVEGNQGVEVEADDGTKSRSVPGGMHVGSPYAFISITGVRRETELVLRYVDLADNSVLMQTTLEVACADPIQTVEIIEPLPPLPTPHPGVFAFEVLCDDGPLGSYRIDVVKIQKETK